MIVTNNLAYVNDSGMKIYDVLDPKNPVYLSSVTNIQAGFRAVSGNRAFLLGITGP